MTRYSIKRSFSSPFCRVFRVTRCAGTNTPLETADHSRDDHTRDLSAIDRRSNESSRSTNNYSSPPRINRRSATAHTNSNEYCLAGPCLPIPPSFPEVIAAPRQRDSKRGISDLGNMGGIKASSNAIRSNELNNADNQSLIMRFTLTLVTRLPRCFGDRYAAETSVFVLFARLRIYASLI